MRVRRYSFIAEGDIRTKRRHTSPLLVLRQHDILIDAGALQQVDIFRRSTATMPLSVMLPINAQRCAKLSLKSALIERMTPPPGSEVDSASTAQPLCPSSSQASYAIAAFRRLPAMIGQ